jgi:hypothetical protein
VAFRETIEAVLKVKDANRFKSGMEKAARSVRKFGRDEEEAAAQTKFFENVLERLDRQSAATTAALTMVAHSVDDLGDEMVETAAKSALLNQTMKKSGSNAVFLGKSWAFWKDRLSLTRSELMTTGLTISAYFSPAIVALGSSFAYAAIGGGGVAAAGLSTLIFGLVGLASVTKPVIENIKQITKAQDQYNIAVEQYGASSVQASRASAHLYGIVRTQGGPALLKAATDLRNFKKEWAKSTMPARGSILSIISGGTNTLRALTPTLASGVNQMAASVQQGLGGLFKTLRGGEMKATFRVMAETFDQAVGPGIKGATNMIVIFSRVIRAAAPWVIKWAKAWERTTHSWRESTSDQGRLEKFFNGAVKHFLAWWGLAKAVGRVLGTIFSLSKDEGLGFVYTLTNIVNGFDNWLNRMNDTGKVAAFWDFWKRSVHDAFEFITHPDTWLATTVNAINRWLPVLMNTIATTFATHAPIAAGMFANAFVHSGAWAQFFTVAYFLKKFGFFKLLGKQVAAIFIGPFLSSFGAAFATGIGIESAAGGTIGSAMTSAGTRAGALFGGAFYTAAILSIVLIGEAARREIDKAVRDKVPGGKKISDTAAFLTENIPIPGAPQGAELAKGLFDQLFGKKKKPKPRGGALGGVIPPGGSAYVGERGMEMARVGPRGTEIVPLNRNSRNNLPSPIDVPDLQGAMNITVHSSLSVDKREIARAVSDQVNYESSRRGGLRRNGGS